MQKTLVAHIDTGADLHSELGGMIEDEAYCYKNQFFVCMQMMLIL